MGRGISFFLLAFGTLFGASRAGAQAYTATLLYPLTGPGGYTNVFPSNLSPSGVNSDTAAQPAYEGETVGSGRTATIQHALLWNSDGTAIDLNPTNLGFTSSQATATNGNQQVGGGVAANGGAHALFWNGTVASAVDLGPGQALGVSPNGAQQVGITDGSTNAMLWNSTAASAVNLNPTSLFGSGTLSNALATDGENQVGSGSGSATQGAVNAVLWSGTAASAVDLAPNVARSEALGVSGAEEVGFVEAGAVGAMLWTGTAASAVNLNPTELTGISDSIAAGTNSTQQVGYGYGAATGSDLIFHALLWSGTADSAVDLHLLLPSDDTWTSSQAFTIDAAGNAYGIAEDAGGNYFAVEWTAVPEPASVTTLGIFGVGMMMRRRRRCARE